MTESLRLLDWPGVKAKGVPYSRMHVDRLERDGNFPVRLQLSANRVAWVESEIDDWILSRPRGPLVAQSAAARRARRNRNGG
jgi:prophage regulatory protein